MTKANIISVAASIGADTKMLHGSLVVHEKNNIPIHPETTVAISDIMGTLAVNMRVFANAMDEERKGRTEFVGGRKPSECLEYLI